MFIDKVKLLFNSEKKEVDVINFKLSKDRKEELFKFCEEKNIIPTNLFNNFINDLLDNNKSEYINIYKGKNNHKDINFFFSNVYFDFENLNIDNIKMLSNNQIEIGNTLINKKEFDISLKSNRDYIFNGISGSGKTIALLNVIKYKTDLNENFLIFNHYNDREFSTNVREIMKNNNLEKTLYFIEYSKNKTNDINIINFFNTREIIDILNQILYKDDTYFQNIITMKIDNIIEENNIKNITEFLFYLNNYNSEMINNNVEIENLDKHINIILFKFKSKIEKLIQYTSFINFNFNSDIKDLLLKGDSIIFNEDPFSEPITIDNDNMSLIFKTLILKTLNYNKKIVDNIIIDGFDSTNKSFFFNDYLIDFLKQKRYLKTNLIITTQDINNLNENFLINLNNPYFFIMKNNSFSLKKSNLTEFLNISNNDIKKIEGFQVGNSILISNEDNIKCKLQINNIIFDNKVNKIDFNTISNNNLIDISNLKLKDIKLSNNTNTIFYIDEIEIKNLNKPNEENIGILKLNENFININENDLEFFKNDLNSKFLNNKNMKLTELKMKPSKINSNFIILSNDMKKLFSLNLIDTTKYKDLIYVLNSAIYKLYSNKDLINFEYFLKRIDLLFINCKTIETLLLGVYILIKELGEEIDFKELKYLMYENYYLYLSLHSFNLRNNLIDCNSYFIWKKYLEENHN